MSEHAKRLAEQVLANCPRYALSELGPVKGGQWIHYADARSAVAQHLCGEDVQARRGFDQLVFDAVLEAQRAMQKFPQPNYVISKIAEEAGEVVKAAIHAAEGRETAENLRGEMKQLIAMLYRLWVEGDEVHGLGSVSEALIPEAKP